MKQANETYSTGTVLCSTGTVPVYSCVACSIDAPTHSFGSDARGVDTWSTPTKVTELKEELAWRDEPVSGNKAWLRRRLHAAIVREHLEVASEE